MTHKRKGFDKKDRQIFKLQSRSRGEMDITSVFETVIPGSNPGESTKNKNAMSVFCALAASHLRVMRQDSKPAALFV